jgi:hypothetical protein
MTSLEDVEDLGVWVEDGTECSDCGCVGHIDEERVPEGIMCCPLCCECFSCVEIRREVVNGTLGLSDIMEKHQRQFEAY